MLKHRQALLRHESLCLKHFCWLKTAFNPVNGLERISKIPPEGNPQAGNIEEGAVGGE